MSEKKTESLTLWSLSLISIGLLSIALLLIGIITPTKKKHLNLDSFTCYSTRCLGCVEKKVQSNMMIELMP